MNSIVYLIQVNLFLLLFYGFYSTFLRKETFNNLNRGYLVVAAVTAFVVPFLQSDYVRSWFVTQQVNDVILTAYAPGFEVIATNASSPILWTDVLRISYICVALILAIRLIVNILMTNQLFSNFSDSIGGAFSFFGKIFVDESLEERDTIYRHEEVHSQHFHSVDVILFEIIAVVCWFNPVVYCYKNAVRNIHEFIADELASQTLNDKAAYATLLVSQRFNISPSVLTNTFYKPATIKLRIEMLLKKRSTKKALLKYGLIAPLFLSMMVLASATVIDKNGLEAIAESVEVPLTELPSVNNLSVLKIDEVSQFPREITGYVKNADGQPLAGAVVTLKNSTLGTITSEHGYFKLRIEEDRHPLIISFVGFETREIPIAGITNVTIELATQENILDELMVVGYPNKPVEQQEIFTTVEQNPEFPGGISAMFDYISERIKYPKMAQQMLVEGKVFVKFVVQQDGSIGGIKILQGIGYGCDDEAIRVISNMPKWSPGKQNGQPVNVYYTMPISFRLNQISRTQTDALGKTDVFPKGTSESKVDFIQPKDGLNPVGTSGTNLRGVINKDGSKPLFVIDGILQSESILQNLNPSDIASINVLKGESAVSLYGNLAKNGVIQIATKKGVGVKNLTTNIYEVKEALYIVDGEEMTYDEYQRKYKKEMPKTTTIIYKSSEAVQKFGTKGKNGVVIIRTKE